DVFVGEADATRRDELAYGGGIVGAVNAVFTGAEIHRARAERIAGAAGDEARQIGLARDHLGWRRPIRPFLLVGDGLDAGPGETLASDADAVAHRAAAAEHEIKHCVAGIDDDGTRRLARIEIDDLAAKALRQHAVFALGRGIAADIALRECT